MTDTTNRGMFHLQLKEVLFLLEVSYKNQPTPMLEMIMTRYKQANEMMENNNHENLTKDMFKIRGGVRAYLEAYSDYMNPMLEEMNKAEKLLEETFN